MYLFVWLSEWMNEYEWRIRLYLVYSEDEINNIDVGRIEDEGI